MVEFIIKKLGCSIIMCQKCQNLIFYFIHYLGFWDNVHIMINTYDFLVIIK